ncbi:hypothetical protein OMK68_03055 [Rhodococcus pyridinivorans]|nr:hypothetical protein [Rhodococcus pyridinivorans]
MVLAAAACFFSRRSGRYDVLVNIPVSARTTAELRRSAGMLVNVVPLRIRVDPSWATSWEHHMSCRAGPSGTG